MIGGVSVRLPVRLSATRCVKTNSRRVAQGIEFYADQLSYPRSQGTTLMVASGETEVGKTAKTHNYIFDQ